MTGAGPGDPRGPLRHGIGFGLPTLLRGALHGRQGRQARAELPLAQAGPRRRQRRHREAPRREAPQGPLHRSRRRHQGHDGAASTPEAEAAYIGREIFRIIKEEGRRPKDFAILYRSNGQSTALQAALREQGVAHKVVGGQQFFERKEVKDLLAYLKVALNRSDETALRRIVNYPPRGIGDRASSASRRMRPQKAGACGRRSSVSTRSTTSRRARAKDASNSRRRSATCGACSSSSGCRRAARRGASPTRSVQGGARRDLRDTRRLADSPLVANE